MLYIHVFVEVSGAQLVTDLSLHITMLSLLFEVHNEVAEFDDFNYL